MDYSTWLDQLVEELEKKWLPEVSDKDIYYEHLPFPTARFLDGLWELQRNRPNTRFIDVGCGIGTKLVLAHLAGFKVTGLEIRPEYIEVAKELCAKFDFEPEFIQADALEFSGYKDYDCIYTYTPFVNRETDGELEKHIIANCQPSALLFVPSAVYLPESDWHKSIHEVWSL